MEKSKRDLGQWVCHASHLFRREMDNSVAAAAGADADEIFSGRNLWVLRYVKDREGTDVYQRDLEQEFKVRRSTISRMIDLMVRKQYLTRESVEGDQRLKRLRLTEKGETMLREVVHSIDELEARLRASFTPEEYDALVGLLDRLCRTLDAEAPETTERKEPEVTHV